MRMLSITVFLAVALGVPDETHACAIFVLWWISALLDQLGGSAFGPLVILSNVGILDVRSQGALLIAFRLAPRLFSEW